MPALFLSIFRFLRLLLSGHPTVAIENVALRVQLAAFQRQRKRTVRTTLDRVFWVSLRSLWSEWRGPLYYVQPDTVVRWQRERFRRFWARWSKPRRRPRGRPVTAAHLRCLIERMVAANPLWRAPRIHGELKMLGVAISERTVSRILRKLPRPPSQTWKTFLRNHVGQTVSLDFFTVPTITLKVLFVFLVLEHRRREVLHFNITEHPTAAWTAHADRRGLRRSRPSPISHPGSGQHLRPRRRFANHGAGHDGSPDRAAQSMAESICRATDRLDSKRVPEPLHHPECPTSKEDASFVSSLLP